ncbi:MAG: hypothetical protein Q8R67_04430 [Rhodoferax sp.]|nr:hypothetical protein [Rhodoferax sp.]MDP3650912.1 hypothetical protein [Rhodoferax sp.]
MKSSARTTSTQTVSGTSVAGPIRIGNATTCTPYDTAKHNKSAPTRPGAQDAFMVPSRSFDRLHHRDGKVTTYPGVTS